MTDEGRSTIPIPAPGVVAAETGAASGRPPDPGAIERMLGLAAEAAGYAHAPVSDFHVGVAVLGGSGAVYLGANLELDGAPLNLAVHAEQAAIANALMHDERSVRMLAANAEPCGHCRQFLQELGTGELLVATPDAVRPLSELLPAPFEPSALGVTANALAARDAPPLHAAFSLAEAALAAAARSHAPYTDSPAGVALELEDGSVVAGAYIESVAYNPSLDALRAALALARFRGWPVNRVQRIELAHSSAGRVDHAHALRETVTWLPEAPGSIEIHAVDAD